MTSALIQYRKFPIFICCIMCPPRKNAEPWLWLKHHPEIAAGLNKTPVFVRFCWNDMLLLMTFGCNFESSMILEPWDKGGKARSFRYLWNFISERFFGLFMLLFGVIFTTFVV